MGRFDGTVALVSGGARGMGASHVRALVDEGAKVVIGDILDDDGNALAADATYSTGSEFVVDGGAVLGPVIDLGQE